MNMTDKETAMFELIRAERLRYSHFKQELIDLIRADDIDKDSPLYHRLCEIVFKDRRLDTAHRVLGHAVSD